MKYKKYACACGYIYDEAVGDKNNDTPPETKWKDITEDFECPVCSAGKYAFSKIEANND